MLFLLFTYITRHTSRLGHNCKVLRSYFTFNKRPTYCIYYLIRNGATAEEQTDDRVDREIDG